MPQLESSFKPFLSAALIKSEIDPFFPSRQYTLKLEKNFISKNILQSVVVNNVSVLVNIHWVKQLIVSNEAGENAENSFKN